ncbi:MAG: RNA polymerase sigma factor [Chthoniobacterales bacterium]
MKTLPGTLQGGGAPFATTRWSVVAACQDDEVAEHGETQAAIAQLCRDYWPPLYSFVRRRGYAPADAQDLVQGFFSHFLRKKIYCQTESARGKFRSFLLASLKNYLADAWEKERAAKRGGDREIVLLNDELHAAEQLHACEIATLDEEQLYEQRWAVALVSRALENLASEFRAGKKEGIFRELKPLVAGGSDLPKQEEIAARLEMPIETLRSHLSRLRARYRDLLRREVARTIGFADDVDEELRQLARILIAAA